MQACALKRTELFLVETGGPFYLRNTQICRRKTRGLQLRGDARDPAAVIAPSPFGLIRSWTQQGSGEMRLRENCRITKRRGLVLWAAQERAIYLWWGAERGVKGAVPPNEREVGFAACREHPRQGWRMGKAVILKWAGRYRNLFFPSFLPPSRSQSPRNTSGLLLAGLTWPVLTFLTFGPFRK